MCPQLLLLLEKDSSFDVVQNTMQGYRLPVGTTYLTALDIYGKQSIFDTGRKFNKICYEHVRTEARPLANLPDL